MASRGGNGQNLAALKAPVDKSANGSQPRGKVWLFSFHAHASFWSQGSVSERLRLPLHPGDCRLEHRLLPPRLRRRRLQVGAFLSLALAPQHCSTDSATGLFFADAVFIPFYLPSPLFSGFSLGGTTSAPSVGECRKKWDSSGIQSIDTKINNSSSVSRGRLLSFRKFKTLVHVGYAPSVFLVDGRPSAAFFR
jgi:hypothetical protein